MSLKILLADDSMTAQNMGKKILCDAGYEVIAVSNGAAAVKKIAEQRPDLAILDIYMPGYTGLEVCERVKSTLESSRTPVLLTVGKMEPYRPEDGTRVRADGVIVKPFEATDLLAVVEKLAGNIIPAKPAKVEAEPTASEAAEDVSAGFGNWKQAEEAGDATGPERIQVPQEMQVAPAMGLEDFGVEPVEAEIGAVAEIEMEPEPGFAPEAAVLLETAMASPVGFVTDALVPELEEEMALEPMAPAEVSVLDASGESVIEPFEVEFNSAPQASDVEVNDVLPELEPTQQPNTIEVATVTDPALADPTEYATEFATGFGVAKQDDVPVGVIAELQETQELPTGAIGSGEEEDAPDDFEARVAAAMAAYEAPAAENSVEPEWKIEEAPLAAEEAEISLEAELAQTQTAVEVLPEAAPVAEVVQAAELEPAVEATEPVVEASAEIVAEPLVEAFEAEPVETVDAQLTPEVEAPAEEPVHENAMVAAAAAAAGAASMMVQQEAQGKTLDESRIASAIQKVLERLKPQLVSEIARELASEDEEK